MSNNDDHDVKHMYPPPPPTQISPSSPTILPQMPSPSLTLHTPSHLSPSIHPPGFFGDMSRVSSLNRIGSELPPLSSYSPFPPATPQASHSPHVPRGLTRGMSVPPIITNLPTPSHMTMGASPHPPFNPPTTMIPLQEMSLLKWRTSHAVFIAGCVFIAIGLMVGLATSSTTNCKVPYMAYSYYDNYVPYADMECTTHPRGWYAGAPILTLGVAAVGLSWYYNWVKVQEMKMASKYHVAMV